MNTSQQIKNNFLCIIDSNDRVKVIFQGRTPLLHYNTVFSVSNLSYPIFVLPDLVIPIYIPYFIILML